MARLAALLESSLCKSQNFRLPGDMDLGSCDPDALDGKTHFEFEKISFHKSIVFVTSRRLWLHVLENCSPNCVSGKGFQK